MLSAFASLAPLGAQDITIRAVNGKNGKPLARAHLLIWSFDQVSDRGMKKSQQQDLYTDENGIVLVALSTLRYSHLQVWVDFSTLCIRGTPNSVSFPISIITASGLNAENACSRTLLLPTEPNGLTVYARPATFAERMRW